MKDVIGIDLGTTNCCVAVVQGGRPKVIEDEKGYNILPSYISIKGANKFIVGHGAKAQAISNPTGTLRAIKRLIGRKINTPEVEEARKRMSYEILEGPNYDILLKLGDATMSPVEASSVLLKCIKGIAEKYLGREVSEAVITCPAYFTNAQRKTTIEAGQKAGLKVLRLLNEPTAAALAYGYKKDLEKRLVIFDLGGGTFDVSILEVGSNVYEVLATNGNSFLGGEDFDYRVVDHLAGEFMRTHSVDLRHDDTALQRLKDAAERAKCELSFVDKTQIMIPHVHKTHNLQIELTRDKLEELTEDLVKKTFDVVKQTLGEANLSVSDVDDVILVGGQTRMPRIQETVKSFFGKPPCKGVHPDEAVAIGAAVHADALTEDKGEILLLDVTPFSLGIDSAGNIFTRIVPKNATIPVSESRTFTTVVDNQEKVKIVVRQGEHKKASDNTFLGEFVLTGIRRAPKMEPKIDVVFRIDSNGILNVSAKDRFTGERQSILIKDYFDLATNPDKRHEPVIGPSGADPGIAPLTEDGTADVGTVAKDEKKGKGKGLFSRLVEGFGRKKSKAGATEVVAGQATDQPMPDEEQVGAIMVPNDDVPDMVQPSSPTAVTTDSTAPSQQQAAPPPPPPVAAAPSFDPYGVVPAGHREPAADGENSPPNRPRVPRRTPSASPTPPPLPAAHDDPFVRPSSRQFGGQYTDPFAAIDGGSHTQESLASGGGMPDPFALDGVDPFAVQEKNPSGGAGGVDDVLGSFDLDKLVDELSEGMPTIDRSSQDLPVLKEPLAGGGTPKLSGWDGPGGDAFSDAAALSQAGVDPFAVLEKDLPADAASAKPAGSVSPYDDLFNDAALPTSAGGPKKGAAVPAASNLPSNFIDDTGSHRPGEILARGAERNAATRAPTNGVKRTAIGTPRKSKKKPAKLKIAYKRVDAFVNEYSENLSRGGTFIKTPSPLDLGRECLFELTIPNRDTPICLTGVVVWSSKGLAQLEAGQEPGMGIKYRFDDVNTKRKLEQILDELRVSV